MDTGKFDHTTTLRSLKITIPPPVDITYDIWFSDHIPKTNKFGSVGDLFVVADPPLLFNKAPNKYGVVRWRVYPYINEDIAIHPRYQVHRPKHPQLVLAPGTTCPIWLHVSLLPEVRGCVGAAIIRLFELKRKEHRRKRKAERRLDPKRLQACQAPDPGQVIDLTGTFPGDTREQPIDVDADSTRADPAPPPVIIDLTRDDDLDLDNKL